MHLKTKEDYLLLPVGTTIIEYRSVDREPTGWEATKRDDGLWHSTFGRTWTNDNQAAAAANPAFFTMASTVSAPAQKYRDSDATEFRNRVRRHLQNQNQGLANLWYDVGVKQFDLHRNFGQPICPADFRQKPDVETPEEKRARCARNHELVQAYINQLVYTATYATRQRRF